MKTALPIKINNKTYIILLILSCIYILFLLISSVFINKLITLCGHITTMSAFFFPMTFLIADIVLEVYGYRIARALILTGLTCQFLFAAMCKLAINIAAPPGTNIDVHYLFVLNNLIPIYFGALGAAFVGDFINVYVLSKLKILTQGRFFALRSIGSSIVGNLVYTTICCYAIYYHTQPLHNIIEIGLMIYLVKIIYAGLLAFPAAAIATIIKTAGEIDVYDYNISFNPFRLLDGIKE